MNYILINFIYFSTCFTDCLCLKAVQISYILLSLSFDLVTAGQRLSASKSQTFLCFFPQSAETAVLNSMFPQASLPDSPSTAKLMDGSSGGSISLMNFSSFLIFITSAPLHIPALPFVGVYFLCFSDVFRSLPHLRSRTYTT